MSQPPLVINLTGHGTENFEGPNEILQRNALKRLDDLIGEQLSSISEEKNYAKVKETSLSYTRSHNAILIQGGRGSGKTTFLLNALHRLNSPQSLNNPEEKCIADVAVQLHILPMIDPTLIETKENIIIVILSMIEAAIGKISDDDGKMEEARQALSEGLGLLDGIGPTSAYGSEWEDASWVMSRGLHKAKKGRSFELKFGVYLETALSILKKKAFVLAFDDVDTNFNHGHTILETIRKYLTSPRLVLLLSGDLDLYGRLLRRNIYNTFGKQVLKHDPDIIGEDKHNLAHAVLELEEQYLLKVIPPQNRIPMLPLGGIMQGSGVSVRTSLSEQAPQDLAFWATEKIRKLLLEKEGQPQSFFEFVSMEHLRLVIGYLQALNQDDKKASRQMILKVFETRLRTNQVPTDLIERGNFDYALRSAFEWLGKQDDAPDLLQFGVPVGPIRAVVLHCLALALSQSLESQHGGALKTLFALAIPIKMTQRPENVDRETRASIFRFLWTQSSPSLPELAARIGSIDRSLEKIGKVSASSFGTVGLNNTLAWKDNLQRVYGLIKVKATEDKLSVTELASEFANQTQSVSSKNWITEVDLKNGDLQVRQNVGWFSIDDLILEERSEKFSAVLRLITYRRFSQRGEIFRSLSALSLFSAIGDLLMAEKIGDLTTHSVTAIVPAFKREKAPDDRISSTESDNDTQAEIEPEGSEDNSAYDTEDNFSEFMQNLKDWHTFARVDAKSVALSPSMLGSIASRIHDDLIDLDEKVTSTWKSGEILHRQITNILHGMLVLTSELSGRKDSPKKSDRPLREALGRTFGNKKEASLHPLMVIILSCPLIWVFLNPRIEQDRSGSSTGLLRDVANDSLEDWQSSQISDNTSETLRNFASWLLPPKVRINIGSKLNSTNQRSVELDGFFDVLNVVPRNVTK